MIQKNIYFYLFFHTICHETYMVNTNHKCINSDSVRMSITFQYTIVYFLLFLLLKKESRSYARNNKIHIQVSQ